MNAILTVSQINTYVSFKLKNDPKLRGIAVKGEISDLSENSRSGHLYFSICDSECTIRAVMFSQSASKLRFAPYEGMAVIAYGSVEVYERGGVYQLIVSQLVPDGAGSAYLSLLKLKEKLEALGVFSAPKRPLPKYPSEIAVVTSPTGAAIQDVKSTISRRYPLVKLTLYPTPVQGADAPEAIAAALLKADSGPADLIILTRGGGSSEDLSAFNTEKVAMAVYGCHKPVVSAVGHEIDWTLCDLAADLRAPTPTAAAELATPDILQMKNELASLGSLIEHYCLAKLKSCEDSLKRYELALSSFSVKEKLGFRRRELENIDSAMDSLAAHRLEVAKLCLGSLKGLLSSLDPVNVVSRGYAIVVKDGEIASSADKLSAGDEIRILMRGGSAEASVNKIKGEDYEL